MPSRPWWTWGCVTNIVVHRGGVPPFVRILMMGGQDVTDAVADSMGVTRQKAEALKQLIGSGIATREALTAGPPLGHRGRQRTFVDEVRGSLDYYLASSGSTPITRLVLTGGGARLGGLAQRLQAMTRVAVEVGTPMHSLQVGRTGLSPEQIAFVEPLAAVPVGLALGVAS